MKRSFDLLLAVPVAVVALVPLAIIAVLVKLTSKGPVLYWSDRIGRDNRVFSMPKFRTMRIDAPEVASHLLSNPDQWLIPLGGLLRRTSLDELPQLWSILHGDMSLVGPRPALHNQYDLIALRTMHGVHRLTPGLTGWAQVNGRDEMPIPEKVALDVFYLQHHSFWFDLRIFAMTALQVICTRGATVPSQMRGLDQGTTVPVDAYVTLAGTWLAQGELDRAIAACDHALARAPQHPGARAHRDAALAARGNGVCRPSRSFGMRAHLS